MRPIPNRAITFVGQLEGCVLKAYPDPATHGDPWTVGYGHCGPDVKPGVSITAAQAVSFLKSDLAIARTRLYSAAGDVVDELSEAQFCALLSFVLNLGANPSWSIWKILKARKFDQIPAQMMRFTVAAGKPNKGLMNRRAAECSLWAEDAHEEPLPSSVTRNSPTPPTPADTKPLGQSKSFMTAAATAGTAVVAAASQGVSQVSQAVAPFAGSSKHIADLVAALSMIAAGLAVATLIFVWLKRQRAG